MSGEELINKIGKNIGDVFLKNDISQRDKSNKIKDIIGSNKDVLDEKLIISIGLIKSFLFSALKNEYFEDFLAISNTLEELDLNSIGEHSIENETISRKNSYYINHTLGEKLTVSVLECEKKSDSSEEIKFTRKYAITYDDGKYLTEYKSYLNENIYFRAISVNGVNIITENIPSFEKIKSLPNLQAVIDIVDALEFDQKSPVFERAIATSSFYSCKVLCEDYSFDLQFCENRFIFSIHIGRIDYVISSDLNDLSNVAEKIKSILEPLSQECKIAGQDNDALKTYYKNFGS